MPQQTAAKSEMPDPQAELGLHPSRFAIPKPRDRGLINRESPKLVLQLFTLVTT
jgi:hypothetical protein